MESKGVVLEKTDVIKDELSSSVSKRSPSLLLVCAWALWIIVGIPVALLYVKMYPNVLACLMREKPAWCGTSMVLIDTFMFWAFVLAWPCVALVTVLPIVTVAFVNMWT